jgi:hypothetical protein
MWDSTAEFSPCQEIILDYEKYSLIVSTARILFRDTAVAMLKKNVRNEHLAQTEKLRTQPGPITLDRQMVDDEINGCRFYRHLHGLVHVMAATEVISIAED